MPVRFGYGPSARRGIAKRRYTAVGYGSTKRRRLNAGSYGSSTLSSSRRRYRRSRYKYRTRSRRRARKSKKRFNPKQALYNALKTKNLETIIFEGADWATVPTTTTTSGKQRSWMYFGLTNNYMQALDCIYHYQQICNIISSGPVGELEQKFIIKDCNVVHTLTNTNLGHCYITAYKCMARRDIPLNEGYQDPRVVLGDGYYQRSIDTVRGSNNLGVTLDSLSIFDSHKFCSMFKVLRVKRVSLDGGMSKSFYIRRGCHLVNMQHYFTSFARSGAGSTWINSTSDYSHRKGELFYLFAITGQVMDDSTTITNLGASRPKIDMITRVHYNYVNDDLNLPLITVAAPIGYGAVNVGQYVDDEKGGIVNDANA